MTRLEAAPGDLCDIPPTGAHADTPIVLRDAAGKAVFAIVVEVQLSREKPKRLGWPLYTVALHYRLGCEVMLLIACPASLANWCAETMRIGPGHELYPYVTGLEWVPLVTDPTEAAARPDMAALSAMGHGDGPHREAVFAAFIAGMNSLDPDRASLYIDTVHPALCVAAQKQLEALVTSSAYEHPQSTWGWDFWNRGKAEGIAEGKAAGDAELLLIVLEERGITVPDSARTRITGCTDLGQLKAWTRRAVTANTTDDLFA